MLFPKIRRAVWIICIGISAMAIAQDIPTIRVTVDLVNVIATVRDRSGRLINNLSKEDFILEEDGKPQEITNFSRQTDTPLTIGLLIDTSGSQRNMIPDEQMASLQFLNQVMRPNKDGAFVIKFDSQPILLQDLTNSPQILQNALAMLGGGMMGGGMMGGGMMGGGMMGGGMMGGRGMMGGGGMGGGAGTVLFDAVFLASDQIMQRLEGRKTIILISDGVDMGSKVPGEIAAEAAHRGDTIIYSIRYYDSSTYGNRGGGGILGSLLSGGSPEEVRGRNTLTALAQDTGGRMFEVGMNLNLMDIFNLINEELRNQYSIGYQPAKPPAPVIKSTIGSGIGGATGASGSTGTKNSGGFHRIRLGTKHPNLEVISRNGYFSK
jgi:VWFA-related protein